MEVYSQRIPAICGCGGGAKASQRLVPLLWTRRLRLPPVDGAAANCGWRAGCGVTAGGRRLRWGRPPPVSGDGEPAAAEAADGGRRAALQPGPADVDRGAGGIAAAATTVAAGVASAAAVATLPRASFLLRGTKKKQCKL
jgi:hypothetical protein